MRDSVIDVAGTKLGYREAGAGATVLFLHGAAGAAWDPLLDRLSGGYACWRRSIRVSDAGRFRTG